MHVAVVIVAAGRGYRAGGDVPKQYRPIAGITVLRRTIDAFCAALPGALIQCVIHPDDRAFYDAATAGLGLPPPVPGGATRRQSALAGLEALAAWEPETVLVHDAARPFASPGLIRRVADSVTSGGGVLPALAVIDTLWRGLAGACDAIVPREGLWRAQTPQGFDFAAILAAHRNWAGDGEATDDVAVARAAGMPVAIVAGEDDNRKMTTPDDFSWAEARLTTRSETRTGSGFDVHRFGPGDHVWLCGVKVAHDAALVGHSDADVALHALTDALLGAIGAGDIGDHFPPSDPQWRGAASDRFLRHAAALVASAGGRIVNVDLTIIAERPRIGPHRDAMRASVAGILGIDMARVSVKATTTEKLGFTGRQEGIAVQAVASVEVPA